MRYRNGDIIISKKQEKFIIDKIYSNYFIIVKNSEKRLYYKIKRKDVIYFEIPTYLDSFISGADTWSGLPNKNILRYFYKPNELRKLKLKKIMKLKNI